MLTGQAVANEGQCKSILCRPCRALMLRLTYTPKAMPWARIGCPFRAESRAIQSFPAMFCSADSKAHFRGLGGGKKGRINNKNPTNTTDLTPHT